jgi:hypothetical protein
VHCITLESDYRVPTVGIHAKPFASVVKSVAFTKGMPGERFAFVPMPVMGKSAAELRAYVDGNDPVTGRPVMEEVVEALTKPLGEAEKQITTVDRSTPRLVGQDSEDNLQQLFLDNGWTDRLPIVLPTEERIAAMLRGTSRNADEIVGELRPTRTREAWQFTVEKVAVNAVMAGARPEYFPVILALSASGCTARPSTTTSGATMAVVNGPIRHEIAMNSGIGAMGPYNHANATIGRAFGLLSQNLQGGSVPGETYMGSQGNNYAYNSVTYAENEERSPWEPLHAQHGFKAGDSVVNVFRHCRTTSFQMGLREKHWREHVQYLLRGINPHSPPTLILDPIVARQFIDRGGFDTKEKLIRWIYETATIPAGVYWDDQLIQNYIHPRALKGEEPYATMLKAAPDEWIPMNRLDEIEVVVVGGETNGYWRVMGCNYDNSVSIDAWR